MEASNSTITTRQIWIRYVLSFVVIGALMAGFLYLVEDEVSRFRMGGGVFAVCGMVLNLAFDRKLPDKDNFDWILLLLDLVMFGLCVLLVLQIGKELNFTQDTAVKIFANPLVWFILWGLLAANRFRMGIKATRQLAEMKGTKLSDGYSPTPNR